MTPSARARDALDRYWDDVVARSSHVDQAAGRDLPSSIPVAVERFHARDDAPQPNDAFIRQLREDLMERAIDSAGSPRRGPWRRITDSVRGAPIAGQAHSPRRVERQELPARPGRGWLPAFELAAVCLLFLTIVGVVGGNGRLGALIAGLQEDDDDQTGMFLGNAARNGQYPGEGITGWPGMLWQETYGQNGNTTLYGPPIIGDDSLFFLGERRIGVAPGFEAFLLALSTDSGTARWEHVFEIEEVATAPAVAEGRVFVGTNARAPGEGGAVIALDAATGEEVWRQPTGDSSLASPAVVDGTVFIGSLDGSLDAFDAATGEVRWHANPEFFRSNSDGQFMHPFPSAGTVAVVDGKVFVPVAAPVGGQGSLAALDASDGQMLWQVQLPFNATGVPVVDDGTVFVTSNQVSEDERDQARILHAFDAETGRQHWSYPEGGAISARDGLVYVTGTGVDDNLLVALDAATGMERWTVANGSRLFSPPVIAGENLYLTTSASVLSALDPEQGTTRWTVEGAPGGMSSVVVGGDRVFYASGATVSALGNSAAGFGTPIATPIIGGDVSGLPPCTAQPRLESSDPPLLGTPAASVTAGSAERYGQPAGMRLEDVPTGEPATEDEIAGIRMTLEAMVGCDRPGRERQLASFYSDDYFRRGWVEFRFANMGSGYATQRAPLSPFDLDGADIRRLADGRVAVLTLRNDEFGVWVAFANVGGRWLIDETVGITPHPEAGG